MLGCDDKAVVGTSLVVQTVKNLPAMRETQVWAPGGRHGNPLQCSCLGNPMNREAWWDTVQGFAELDTTTGLTLSLFSLWLYVREEEKGKRSRMSRDCAEVFIDENDTLSEICVNLPRCCC